VPDRDAVFAEVMREFGIPLERLAAAYTHSAADRDDLYQEILLAIWSALPAFRGTASRRTYVYRIAHNRAITFRGRQPRPTAPLDEAHTVASSEPSPDAAVLRDDDTRSLLAAVQALTPSLRQVIVMQLEGLSPAEIAEVIGTSVNAVNVRAHRARESLRLRLSPDLTPA